MEKILMIKYGELTTKKGNINHFISCLRRHLSIILKNDNVEIKYDKGRMFLSVGVDDLPFVTDKLKKVFGIHEIIIGYKYETREFEFISEKIIELIKDKNFNTFKIESKRSDKSYPINSIELNKRLGGVVLNNFPDKKVDINNPEVLINVEIRNNASIIYFEKVSGLGGYPVGSLGKGLSMLSGGIDSPVAGYMAIKRGVRLEAIYFESPPHTSVAAKNKVFKLAEKLAVYNIDMKIYIINFTEIQEEIYKNIPHEYLITIMRRMMYRISERIARRNNARILVNGESIGQVASQTLTSMEVINKVVDIPVIRPVACFDKNEIIKISKAIDTYETSILPYEDCCTIFVPEHPVINPDNKLCEEYEKLIPYEELISKAINTREVIRVSELNKFEELL